MRVYICTSLQVCFVWFMSHAVLKVVHCCFFNYIYIDLHNVKIKYIHIYISSLNKILDNVYIYSLIGFQLFLIKKERNIKTIDKTNEMKEI